MNTRKYYLLLATAFFALLLTSCYREKPIQAELGKPRYQITDSSDPVDHLIYQVYAQSGIQLVYDFNTKNVNWNLGTLRSKGRYTILPKGEAKSKEILAQNLKPIVEEFIGKYPIEFQKKYMPLRIFLCDSILGVTARDKEELVWMGRDHLSINLYSEGETNYGTKPRSKFPDFATFSKESVTKMHTGLFSYLAKYRVAWPESFTNFSSDLYGKNIIKKADAPNFDPRTYGFWDYDKSLYAPRAYYRAIKLEEDIAQFVERFVSYTEEENKAALEGFPELTAKFNILREHIRTHFGLDLQEIGNQKSK